MDDVRGAAVRGHDRLCRVVRSAADAAYATGLVWLLLFGGVGDAVESSTDDDSDAAKLARDTLVPRLMWKAGYVVVAVFCLWTRFRLLAPWRAGPRRHPPGSSRAGTDPTLPCS
jgi:hypothetical protein